MTLIVLSVAVLVGLTIGQLLPLEPRLLVLAAAGACAGALAGWAQPAARTVGLCALAVALAGLRVALWPAPGADGLTPIAGQVVTVVGSALGQPTTTARSARVLVDVDRAAVMPPVGPPWLRPLVGRVQMVGPPDGALSAIGVGDRLAATGRLVALDDTSPTSAVLQRQSVFNELVFPRVDVLDGGPPSLDGTLPARLRQAADRAVRRFVPPPQAALAAGMLLGGSGGLDPAVRAQFRTAGLAHLMSVDGYKQVLVAGAVSRALARLLGRRLALAPTLLVILGYTVLTGASAAAVRAGLMTGAASVAGVVGRVPDPLTSVLVAAAVMALVQPPLLVDASFQMSVSATLGLILLYPRLRRLLSWPPGWTGDQIAVSTAASLATLPVTLALFGQLSLISPLAHVVAMPLVPPALLLTGLVIATAWLPPFAILSGWLVWLPTTALMVVARVASAVPGASLDLGRAPPLAALLTGSVILAVGVTELPEVADAMQTLRAVRLGQLRMLLLPLLIVGAVLIGLVLTRPDGRLYLDLFQAGGGLAALAHGPTGRTVLVVGPDADTTSLGDLVGGRLPTWQHSLDAIVLLDPSSAAGVSSLVARFPTHQLLATPTDGRIDLGGGAVLDLYAADADAAAVRFGSVWIRLSGRPPPALDAARFDAPLALFAPSVGEAGAVRKGGPDTGAAPGAMPRPLRLVSDGINLWRVPP
ncbi:MAG: ComEC/Rec2 family competence protein [Chloroflexi bacterium]|nr:ComEC/Rec2 family competence protein [Chloroflexota bacterium]